MYLAPTLVSPLLPMGGPWAAAAGVGFREDTGVDDIGAFGTGVTGGGVVGIGPLAGVGGGGGGAGLASGGGGGGAEAPAAFGAAALGASSEMKINKRHLYNLSNL